MNQVRQRGFWLHGVAASARLFGIGPVLIGPVAIGLMVIGQVTLGPVAIEPAMAEDVDLEEGFHHPPAATRPWCWCLKLG